MYVHSGFVIIRTRFRLYIFATGYLLFFTLSNVDYSNFVTVLFSGYVCMCVYEGITYEYVTTAFNTKTFINRFQTNR